MMEYARRLFPGDREATVIPLTYGRARITIGEAGSDFYDDAW